MPYPQPARLFMPWLARYSTSMHHPPSCHLCSLVSTGYCLVCLAHFPHKRAGNLLGTSWGQGGSPILDETKADDSSITKQKTRTKPTTTGPLWHASIRLMLSHDRCMGSGLGVTGTGTVGRIDYYFGKREELLPPFSTYNTSSLLYPSILLPSLPSSYLPATPNTRTQSPPPSHLPTPNSPAQPAVGADRRADPCAPRYDMGLP